LNVTDPIIEVNQSMVTILTPQITRYDDKNNKVYTILPSIYKLSISNNEYEDEYTFLDLNIRLNSGPCLKYFTSDELFEIKKTKIYQLVIQNDEMLAFWDYSIPNFYPTKSVKSELRPFFLKKDATKNIYSFGSFEFMDNKQNIYSFFGERIADYDASKTYFNSDSLIIRNMKSKMEFCSGFSAEIDSAGTITDLNGSPSNYTIKNNEIQANTNKWSQIKHSKFQINSSSQIFDTGKSIYEFQIDESTKITIYKQSSTLTKKTNEKEFKRGPIYVFINDLLSEVFEFDSWNQINEIRYFLMPTDGKTISGVNNIIYSSGLEFIKISSSIFILRSGLCFGKIDKKTTFLTKAYFLVNDEDEIQVDLGTVLDPTSESSNITLNNSFTVSKNGVITATINDNAVTTQKPQDNNDNIFVLNGIDIKYKNKVVVKDGECIVNLRSKKKRKCVDHKAQ